ncbi:hypothetical protein D3C77_637060 [compost metagenome]
MDSSVIGTPHHPLTGPGHAQVDQPSFHDGKVWINDDQYFDDVRESTWELFIGGYQPAQKWLKDRRGRTLTFSEVKHYQKILKVISDTNSVMGSLSMTM